MNCRAFQKYAGAFADGELDTPANAEALEHLNMCPRCAGRVTELQQLKASLARVLRAEAAPTGLADRIRHAVRAEAGEPAGKPGVWAHRLLVPLSMAAAVVAAVAVWQFWGDDQLPTGVATALPVRFAADTREQHLHCAEVWPEHHDKTLGDTPASIAAALTERLKLAVIAPDLERFGFQLVGADACGIGNRVGGHVLYRDKEGRLLSVFSVAAADCDGIDFALAPGLDSPGRCRERSDGLSIIAWSEGCAAYVLCGPLEQPALGRIVADIRREAR